MYIAKNPSLYIGKLVLFTQEMIRQSRQLLM